jgi:integrase
MTELLTTAQLAKRLHYRSASGVHMAVRRGQLPKPIVRGRCWLFAWDQVVTMLTRVASWKVTTMTDMPTGDSKPRKKRRQVAPGLWQLNTDLYEIRVRGISPTTGKMTSRWRQFEGSRRDALKERERLHEELKNEAQPTAARETLSIFARSWLSTGLARADWRETTARRYAESLDLHVLPSLGHVFVDELTPRAIERALGDWAQKFARSSVNSWLRVLRTVLSDAVAQGMIANNPAARVRALRERRDDDGDEDDWANALSPGELDVYLRAWRELHPEHLPLIVTLVLTGLRWGEATALSWADVEAAESCGVLRIRRSHVRGVIRNTTKTGKRRAVPFPPELATVLRAHRQRLVEAQHAGLKHGWVFANGAGKPKDNGALFAHNRAVLKHAGIAKRVTLHGLRRTATDLLRRAAVDPVTAKAIIGHTTDRMREHYSTVGTDEARAIGASLISLVPAVTATKAGGG